MIPILRGEVRVGDAPLSDGFVVLHQVSAESSGEVDSVRVEADGSFQILLPHMPDHATRPEIFFASVQYRGLLYFGQAVTDAVQLDTLYLIQAYDTLSVPPGGAQIPLSARNLFLERTETGWSVADVFQLRHDGDRTLYSPEEGVVWAYPLPGSATDFEVGQADMAPDAIRFVDGRLEVYSPLPPGERYLMIRYQLSELDFVVPMPGRTDRMEILVREPAPAAEFYPLSLSSPVELEPGNAFRRYAADSLLDQEVRSEIAPEPWSLPAEWLGLLLAGLLGVAGIFGYRRRGSAPPRRAVSSEKLSRSRLLLTLAKLDEDFQGGGDLSQSGRSRYEAERKNLLSRLKHLS
ncbi:MAG: hypothetical protein ABIF09_09165 [Gemmatimonadota bacterium]